MKKKNKNSDDSKSKRIILLIVTIVLILAVIGITYALFNPAFEDNEITETINVTGGDMNITYSGGPNINFVNAIPQGDAVAVKNFTVVGNNTHTSYAMKYLLNLVVTENTFTNNAITYTLMAINTSENGTTAMEQLEQVNLLAGVGEYELGEGAFQFGNNSIHNYTLNIYFPDRGVPQNENQGKSFKARITTTSLP